jgi:uncharacterized protein
MAAAAPMLDVEVCLVGEEGCWRVGLKVGAGATVGEALEASGVSVRRPGGLAGLAVAVFGRHADPDQQLVDGDRIELLPALTVDPKLARQRRAEKKRREHGDARWRPGRE